MVDIPRKGRANVVVVDRENNRLVHIEKLYDTIKASRNGINRKTHPYIWQWSISASEYDDICNALYICKSLYREEVNDLINNEKCVFIIVAFIAEQYKREWFGNNGNKENALEQLGLGDKVEIIAETYFGDRSKDIIFKHPSSGRLEYLDSLRVEGGLPIKYIVEGDNQLSNFADKLFRDYEQAIKFLLEQLDNKCIRHSYEANYSIYQYLEAIKSEEGPYNIYGPDSENIEIFKKFTSILKSGREKAKQETCKFGLEYSVWRWKYSEEFTLHQNLIFRQSDRYKETNDTISIERLKQWNIEPTYVFWLRIGNNDYEFHPWKDRRYYHSILGYSTISLRDVDLSKSILPEVSIAYIPQKSDGSKDIDSIK